MTSTARELVQAAAALASAVNRLAFRPPVTHVYNPLDYAWTAHEAYVRRFGKSPKRVVFLGLNPGPFGMVQTGVPFGEVRMVRDWMGITAAVGRPAHPHPKRPIDGFGCTRSEVSGRRLWGLFAERFGRAEAFFAEHFVINYCPLAFFDEAGRNLTPDKLPAAQAAPLLAACDAHLRHVVAALRPHWVIGVGGFAAGRASAVLGADAGRLGKILHPSPASPAANRGWAEAATRQLEALGAWSERRRTSGLTA
jgi:single-strand selective monofunctional uracil DNA glycosylase